MPKYFGEDPGVIWPDLDEDLLAKVSRWVERSELILETKFPDLARRVQTGALKPEVVASVVEEMVDRAINFEQREGIVSESLPEWRLEYERSQGLGSGSRLFLTTDEYALLAPPRRRRGIYSQRMQCG